MKYRINKTEYNVDEAAGTVTCTMDVCVQTGFDIDLHIPKCERRLSPTVWENPERVRKVNRFKMSAVTRCMPTDAFDEGRGRQYAYLKCLCKVCDEIAKFNYLVSYLVTVDMGVRNDELLARKCAARWVFERNAIGVELPRCIKVDCDGEMVDCELAVSLENGIAYFSEDKGIVAVSADDMCSMKGFVESLEKEGKIEIPEE